MSGWFTSNNQSMATFSTHVAQHKCSSLTAKGSFFAARCDRGINQTRDSFILAVPQRNSLLEWLSVSIDHGTQASRMSYSSMQSLLLATRNGPVSQRPVKGFRRILLEFKSPTLGTILNCIDLARTLQYGAPRC